MLLREMTDPAFAHSFKCFAQLAVAGLALAGLAACGGGGSSTPTPTTPTPAPAQMNIEPANKYLSLAIGSTINLNKQAWAFGVGANASAAEEEAKTQCDRLLGESCDAASDARTDTCSAVATPECSGSNCLLSNIGYAFPSDPDLGLSKQQAETVAIGDCDQNSSSACSIATSDTGQPGVACVGTEGATTSPAPRGVWTRSTPSPSPSSPDYVTFSFGWRMNTTGSWSWAWAGGRQTTAVAAETMAKMACEDRLGSSCATTLGPITNGCAAIAISECPSGCQYPAFGISGRGTRQEAETAAIGTCERYTISVNRGTCRIASSDSTRPGVLCAGTAR